MQSLTLSLIRRHEKELRTFPDALHLRCYILVPICEGVDPIVQEESLIVKRAESPFLGLNRIGVAWYEYGQRIFDDYNHRYKFLS